MHQSRSIAWVLATAIALACLGGCAQASHEQEKPAPESTTPTVSDTPQPASVSASDPPENAEEQPAEETTTPAVSADELRAQLNITEDYRPSFAHGDKGATYQKYIVLHDTEGNSSPSSVVNSWDNNGRLVAAHFVVGKDGSIVQCVPLDKIAHHAGYGDAGHNELYGVEDSRDDKEGTSPIGSWASDYGMNSYSIGIEMVHVGGEGDYPEAQLEAVDGLIAYIDAYYGFSSDVIDHKAWRTGNSDTSPEFADYLANYQDHRTHD